MDVPRESLHVYRRMGTAEHTAWIQKAAKADVDAIQSGNVPKIVADQDYAELFKTMPHYRFFRRGEPLVAWPRRASPGSWSSLEKAFWTVSSRLEAKTEVLGSVDQSSGSSSTKDRLAASRLRRSRGPSQRPAH